MTENTEETINQEITLMTIDEGDKKGVYWTFEDEGDATIWAGPQETEALAIENAQEAIAMAYAMAAEQLFGAK